MSEALSYPAALAPTTPQFAALKDVLDKLDSARAALEQAQTDVDALNQEAYAIAVSIQQQGITDDNYELAPTFVKGRTIEKVDSDLLRKTHMDIYERSNPHVDNNGISAILKSVHTDAEIQELTKGMNKELWLEKSRVTKADLKRAVSKQEYQMLESEGIIVTNTSWNGDIKLVGKQFQNALDKQNARFLPHADLEAEDDDE